MDLKGLISVLAVKTLKNCEEGGPQIAGLSFNSETISPGQLFTCIRGSQGDGHDYHLEAARAGAAALLVEEFVDSPLPQVRVPDTRTALALVAARFYGYPSESLRMIGVTGTNGKSTTACILSHILRQAGISTATLGTIGYWVDNKPEEASVTTPDPVSLQRLLARFRDRGGQKVVMEVSSHAISQKRTLSCNFDVGIYTNLTQDHLDYHKTFARYRGVKGTFISSVAGTGGWEQPPRCTIINIDCPQHHYYLERANSEVIKYSLHNPKADIRASGIEIGAQGTTFSLVTWLGTFFVSMTMLGLYNVANVLAASAAALNDGVSPNQLVAALASATEVPGRFQRVTQGQPFTVIVDYAHTPDGLANVLKAARTLTQGKLLVVFGCGGDRDSGKRPQMGGIASDLADFCFVTDDNPRSEDADFITRQITQGIKQNNYVEIHDRRQAIAEAFSRANPGDVVIIAGKGHETYQIIGTRRLFFDDAKAAAEILKQMGYTE